MIDILGAVYDYVQAFAYLEPDVPQYRDDQIVRGWQNTAVLPQNTTEFCIITLLRTERHGKPSDRPLVNDEGFAGQMWQLVEHVVQIDCCSAEPFVLPQATKLRAEQIVMISNSRYGPAYFKQQSPLLNCLKAEGVSDMSFLDPDKLYTARYMCTLHLEEIQHSRAIDVNSFTAVNLHLENVERHHLTKD